MDDYKPTPQLRYVERPHRGTPGPLLVLQQLWEHHFMGEVYTEWRDVPTESE